MGRCPQATGHAILTAKELCNNAFDSTLAHDCIRVTPVGSNDTVVGDNVILKTNCNRPALQAMGFRT